MRLQIAILALAAVTLAGCVSGVDPATAEAQDRAYCYNLGAKGDKLVDCLIYRDSARRQAQYQRSNALANAGNAMIQYSQQQQMINAMNTPRITNCRQVFNTVQCTTF